MSELARRDVTVEHGETKVTWAASGDIMLAGRVGQALQEYGPPYVFGGVKDILSCNVDLTFGNLEMPFSTKTVPYSLSVHQSYLVAPENVKVLKYLDFDVVNLATNHVMDWGPEALSLTKSLLNENGIESIGAGVNESCARKAAVVRRNGLTIGILGYCRSGEYVAKGNRPGASELRTDIVEEDIVGIREQVDFLVISLHWGLELSEYPYPEDVEFAHKLVDLGADMIVGHHPHVIQGIEEYKGKLIAYSLGNFIFDNYAGHMFSQEAWERRHEGIVLKATIEKGKILEWKAIPILTADFRVVLAEGEDKQRIRQRLCFLSDVIREGKVKEYFYQHGVRDVFKREIRMHWVLLKKEGIKFLLKRIRTFKLRYFKLIGGYFWAKIRKRLSNVI